MSAKTITIALIFTDFCLRIAYSISSVQHQYHFKGDQPQDIWTLI